MYQIGSSGYEGQRPLIQLALSNNALPKTTPNLAPLLSNAEGRQAIGDAYDPDRYDILPLHSGPDDINPSPGSEYPDANIRFEEDRLTAAALVVIQADLTPKMVVVPPRE
jgi:hypothetical protein